MRLGVDPRKADQMVRGTVSLPHGTGKTVRVIVFATGDKAEEARAAGADKVGSDDLIQEITDGFLDFDAAIATPDQMAKVGRIARVLGPRGLMPNPKTGTVTPDVAKAVADIKGGKISFRVDKQSNLHLIIGKASFTPEQLVENYAAALDEVLRAKPSAAKGRYVQQGHLRHDDGPGHPGRRQPHPQPARGRDRVGHLIAGLHPDKLPTALGVSGRRLQLTLRRWGSAAEFGALRPDGARHLHWPIPSPRSDEAPRTAAPQARPHARPDRQYGLDADPSAAPQPSHS